MGWKGESRRHSLSRKGIKTNIDKTKRLSVRNYVARGKSQRFLKNDNGKRVYTGKVAEQILSNLLKHDLDHWRKNYVGHSGFYKEGDMWTAWDNSFGELSVENFWMQENARSWATELNSTAPDMHKKDNLDVIKEIADEVRKEEGILYGGSDIVDATEKDLITLINNYGDWYLGSDAFKDIASTLQSSRDNERDLIGSPYVTDIFIQKVGNRFKESKGFENSGYWRTFS
ncbi:hypothetical protein KAU43_07805 [candidate division WOR-3 bacterium]|nr:hypothetical protein [candidate division WOR-3 bacterium]